MAVDTDERDALDAVNETIGRVPAGFETPDAWPKALTREQVLDLAEAPRGPVDVHRFEWHERVPGAMFHLVSKDPARNVEKYLVWAKAGAVGPRHGHAGDEVILVLEGALQDHTGTFGPGQICHTRAGEVHSEAVAGETDCLCFVVYYGDLIPA